MTTPTELEAAVERVTAEVERTELCAAKGSPFDPSPALAQLHNSQVRWCADIRTLLHALAEANERASLLQTAVHQALPDGWVPVPREPTMRMLHYGDKAQYGATSEWLGRDVYRAMIAAAPEAPTTLNPKQEGSV